jgi:hypothetical protein
MANFLDRLRPVAQMNNEEYRRNQHGAAASGISGVLNTGHAEQVSRRSFSIAVAREAGPTDPAWHVPYAGLCECATARTC